MNGTETGVTLPSLQPDGRDTLDRQCELTVKWVDDTDAERDSHMSARAARQEYSIEKRRREVHSLVEALRDPLLRDLIVGLVSRIRALEAAAEGPSRTDRRPRLSAREQELMQEMADAGWSEPPPDEDIAAIMEGGYEFSEEQLRRMAEED